MKITLTILLAVLSPIVVPPYNVQDHLLARALVMLFDVPHGDWMHLELLGGTKPVKKIFIQLAQVKPNDLLYDSTSHLTNNP